MWDENKRGNRNAYYTDELVVALEHADQLTRGLEQLGVEYGMVDRSESLGLALVSLRSDRQAAEAVEASARAGGGPTGPAPSGTDTDMDRVLLGLRRYFANRYAGWSPTMGKNRLIGGVMGGGKISHGGGSDPVATDRRLITPRPANPGRGVRVGVLDTSITAHPWMAGGWVAPTSDLLSDGDHRAVAGHATFVAGLVLNQAPGCVVESRQVLSNEDGEADSWTVAKEIVELGSTGLDVLNLSFLCFTEDGQPPLVLSAAIDRLDPNILVVAAAGNHGDVSAAGTDGDDRRKPAWPGALDHVVAVGAADDQGEVAAFSPHDVPWVDVLAPGVDVVSTFLDGSVDVTGPSNPEEKSKFDGYACWSGTSFAAALVSGAVAARTSPGRRSAREAWKELLDEAVPGDGTKPPFLRLG